MPGGVGGAGPLGLALSRLFVGKNVRIWIPSLNENGHTRFILNEDFTFYHMDINAEGTELVTIATTAITDCRFQILFEISLNHFARQQYRDSIVSAYAAIERFREHYLQASFLENKFFKETIDSYWSLVGSQSERQLGAYHTTVLLREGAVSEDLNQDHIKFRNKTIHQGKFPDEGKTLKFLEAISTIIHNRLLAQKSIEPFDIAKIYEYQNRKPDNVTKEITINPLLSHEVCGKADISTILNERIESIKNNRFDDGIIWPYKNT
jgi:hypothetical protein